MHMQTCFFIILCECHDDSDEVTWFNDSLIGTLVFILYCSTCGWTKPTAMGFCDLKLKLSKGQLR